MEKLWFVPDSNAYNKMSYYVFILTYKQRDMNLFFTLSNAEVNNPHLHPLVKPMWGQDPGIRAATQGPDPGGARGGPPSFLPSRQPIKSIIIENRARVTLPWSIVAIVAHILNNNDKQIPPPEHKTLA